MKSLSDNIISILAIINTFCAYTYFGLAAFYKVVDPQITIAIVGILMLIYNYLYGSSRGSAKKQDAINEMTKNTTADDIGGSKPPIKDPNDK